MTEEELDLAEMVLCLTNKLNLLKTELTHAQGYKVDAERYRCLAQHVDFGDWFCGYGVVKDSYGGTEDFYMDDKKHMDETIDKAINESKPTKGVTNE